MAKDNTKVILILGTVVGAAALVKYGADIKDAFGKLTFDFKSVKLIAAPSQGNVSGITWSGIESFLGDVLKKGKQILLNKKIGVEIKMAVKNPTNTTIKAPDFAFNGSVMHQGVRLADINIAKAIEIPANGSANITIPLSLSPGTVLNNILDNLKGNSTGFAEIQLKGVGHAMATDQTVDQKFNLLDRISGIGSVKLKRFKVVFRTGEIWDMYRDFTNKEIKKYYPVGAYMNLGTSYNPNMQPIVMVEMLK